MSTKLTIVGLGQIGASVGLALENQKESIQRIGHDKNPIVSKVAQKRGAVDDTKFNLPSAVRDAKIIVLSVPFSEMRSTLEVIAPDLEEDVVVLDMSPVKGQVVEWVKELFPENRHYVGLSPSLNPNYIHRTDQGVESAVADLFEDGVIMLDTLPGTPEEAVKLAADFIRLLGATPMFSDIPEMDGIMASAHLAPQLVAAAWLNATVDQPGWADIRKLASRPFASLTAALAYQDEITSLGEAVMADRENVVHVLDVVIASLSGMRDDILNGDDEDVAERIKQAYQGRDRWMGERLSADWTDNKKSDVPDAPSFWERYFGVHKRTERK